MSTTSKITIQTTVAASLKKSWDYYTLPEHIIHWNFASPDWHCPAAENELYVGGRMRSRMEARDGSFGFDFEGCYKEVRRYEKLVYSLGNERVVAVEWAAEGEKTVVTIQFDAEQEHPLEMQKAGWQAILDNYKRYTEEHP
ncbi:MAG: SRPBCC domain-containing protein [Marinilabiliales bacterium]|nr:SRPBCC domain-containing protein [Marinilabiliales bacterium]